jgi:hypothetical protein
VRLSLRPKQKPASLKVHRIFIMLHTYKVNFKYQRKSVRNNFLGFPMIFFILFYLGITGRIIYSVSVTLVIILTISFVLSLTITLPYHIQYLLENWLTEMTINRLENKLIIKSKGCFFEYDLNEIYVQLIVAATHKPGRFNNISIFPICYYGYVELRCPDNQTFYITSLMMDPFNFPLPVNNIRYTIPFIRKRLPMKIKRSLIHSYKLTKLNEYKSKFCKVSDETLFEKLQNKAKYDKEAIKAAEEILISRGKSYRC